VVTDKNFWGHRGITPLLNYMKEESPFTAVILISGEPPEDARKELYCHACLDKTKKGFVGTLPKEVSRTIEKVVA